MEVSFKAEKDIVERDKEGEAAFKIFVANRLVKATEKISIWGPMKKLSLRSFANWQRKERCIANKKADKSAFAKSLESHVNVADLAETAMKQSAKEFLSSMLWLSLKLLRKGLTCQPAPNLLQSFATCYINIIENILDNYDEGRIFLPHVETISQLTKYLGEALLREYHGSRLSLIVVYGTTTYSNRTAIFSPTILHHNHEEADTIIHLHVLDALDSSPYCNIDVRSPDTNVFIMLIDLCTPHEHAGSIKFVTGQGKFHRCIEEKHTSAAHGSGKVTYNLGALIPHRQRANFIDGILKGNCDK
eukprot:gene8784-14814_t